MSSGTVTLGIVGGTTPVTVALGFLSPNMAINKVLLSASYAMQSPAGFPARPPAGAAFIEVPTTYAPGTSITVYDFEASALVGAGGGTITGTLYP
jgi:hypothetical protein